VFFSCNGAGRSQTTNCGCLQTRYSGEDAFVSRIS
jgi:hypothetical protein